MTARPTLALSLAALALMAAPAMALSQAAPAAPSTPADPVEALLRQKGEQYHRAPDAAQNPAEVSATQRLNTEVSIRNEMAEQADRLNAAQVRAARAEYREQVADNQAEMERREIDATINAQSRAEFNAEQQARYEAAMADWRATVWACETGDTARCRADRRQPVLGDY
jgi:hypothetical protein